jgi:hypothetical protein
MRFLTLYTPANPQKGPPSAETMAKMGAFMEASAKSGVLIATGAVIPSSANRSRIALTSGELEVKPPSAPTSGHRETGGWAILNVNSLEHLAEVSRQFLEVAGDGEVEVLEIMQVPM